MFDFSQKEEGTSLPPQINGVPMLLPYWWHYLRPMLQVALQNTNFRYMLQKEYEHEIEQNPANEDPIEIENNFEVDIELPNENTAIEHIENTFESILREQPDIEGNLINAERGGQELEDIIDKGTEHQELETLELENNLLNENEAENTEVLETPVSPFTEIENTGFDISAENWEQTEQEERRIALTGNVIGTFSNSLLSLMPSLGDVGNDPSIDVLAGEMDGIGDDIVEHNEGDTLELNEAETHSRNGLIDNAMMWNINSISGNGGEMKHSEEANGDHGGMFQIGFQNEEFQNDNLDMNSGMASLDVHDQSTSADDFNMFIHADSTTLSNTDNDNSDHSVDSFSNAAFTTPMNILRQTFDQRFNDHDSSS